MPLELTNDIERVESISRKEFQEKYMKPQIPVIIRKFYGADSPAYTKWSFEYFRKELGDIEVGVYDTGETIDPDGSYKHPEKFLPFKEYIDLVQEKPTRTRLFLFNVFKYKKELKNDVKMPDFVKHGIGFIPLTFFGGASAVTRMHFDIDLNNVFLTELVGRKRVVLFSPKYNELLYRFPFGVHSQVDINSPDYSRFPGLNHVKGIELYIEAGDTVFIPAGWWHHIEYESPGIGVSVRSLNPRFSKVIRGVFNLLVVTHVDDLMRKVLGKKWDQYNWSLAEKRANRKLSKLSNRVAV